ncbi:hypothetical protein DFH11DRAFT_1546490 [Phellopilus nigrolimitatus]|nr:hypothetical protein DFH11DRAFT_1546490 [Phellopilus nigrolimitatus]
MSTTPGAANNNTEGHELETALATIQEAIQAVISHTLIRAEEIGLTEAEMRAYLTLGKRPQCWLPLLKNMNSGASLCKVPNNLLLFFIPPLSFAMSSPVTLLDSIRPQRSDPRHAEPPLFRPGHPLTRAHEVARAIQVDVDPLIFCRMSLPEMWDHETQAFRRLLSCEPDAFAFISFLVIRFQVEDLFCACRGCAAEEDEEEVVLHYIQGQYYFGRLRTLSVCSRGNVEKFMGQGKGKDSVGGSAN